MLVMKDSMHIQLFLAGFFACSLAHAIEKSGTIVGEFEANITNDAGSLRLHFECETESLCRLTTESQSGKRPPTKDVEILNNIRPVEKLAEAEYALRHAIDKRSSQSRSGEYTELMRRLGPVFSSNPVLGRCWDLTYPTPGYSLACTLANGPVENPPVYLFFTLMANCGDVFCRYVIFPLSRSR
jgi:hypothetical protein